MRVSHVGICGTDLHIVHGAMDSRVPRPLAFGHEVSATVVAVGAGVDDWTAGDRVCIFPLLPDDTCDACERGYSHICANLDFVGIDSQGGLQELWNVRRDILVRVPDGLDLADAALVEPVAVAVHDVRRAGVTAGDSVLVLGGGPIGALIATVARNAGARVAVAELDEHRRERVAGWGLELAPAGDPLTAWVEEWTDRRGADIVFEVTGAPSAVLQSTSLARVRGTVVVVAIHPQPRPIDLHRVFWRELSILGARVYERADFETAVDLVSEGMVPEGFVTHVLPLDDVSGALDALGSGAAMKVLIDVAGGK